MPLKINTFFPLSGVNNVSCKGWLYQMYEKRRIIMDQNGIWTQLLPHSLVSINPTVFISQNYNNTVLNFFSSNTLFNIKISKKWKNYFTWKLMKIGEAWNHQRWTETGLASVAFSSRGALGNLHQCPYYLHSQKEKESPSFLHLSYWISTSFRQNKGTISHFLAFKRWQ